MSSGFSRLERIAQLLQRELSILIQHSIDDPRLPKWISISAVHISPDLRFAKIYFTVLKDDPEKTAKILNGMAGFLRKNLASKIKLRVLPNLHFVYDESVAYGERLSRLIDKIDAGDSDKDDNL